MEEAARRQGFDSWAENQVKEGRLSGAKKEEVVSFMMSLPHGEVAQFSAGGKTPISWFKGYVESQPKPALFSRLPDEASEEDHSPVGDFADFSKRI